MRSESRPKGICRRRREQVRDRAQKRSQAEERHAQHQHLAPADAVGEPAERNLQDGHRQPIAAESETNPKPRGSELQAVKREDGQDQEQPQHAQADNAGQSEKDLPLRGSK